MIKKILKTKLLKQKYIQVYTVNMFRVQTVGMTKRKKYVSAIISLLSTVYEI